MSGAGVDWRLYLVTDPHLGGGREAVPGIVHEAVLGGMGVVQVRDKECDDDEFATHAAAVAESVARACTETGRDVPVFVNDRLDVARELGLHLHIGQRDVPFAAARAALPDGLMLGLSIESDAQLAAAMTGPGPAPDVIGVSPVWSTATKTDTADALGPEGADRLARAAHSYRRPGGPGIRAVGIGGVTPETVALLAATELDGVCVVSSIMAAPDPRAAAADLLARWDAARR
ncbi:thiamine phosphate synthase [Dietzia maris]|uniref:thiamine phosphate synthase n=1 Tax=Dietzia TaxID=37914 RepID=UPI0022B4AD95|nr:thiamine phosphate synthase [Dietzia kunjamensis]MCZ4655840.1 thiamine phosphate synthase [Dietzia kunjamensis]MDJ0422342.1 thiamine phosphate synthase [Dietzia kunjamensis]